MRSRTFISLGILLCALAGTISGYLSWTKLSMSGGPVGCGAESGCGAVLTSKWSMLGPVPVSLLATGLYVTLIVVFFLYGKKPSLRPVLQTVLGACAAGIIASVCWFFYVQAAILNAYCVYCNTDHSLGVALSILIAVHLFRKPEPARNNPKLGLAAITMIGAVAGLGFVQASSKGAVHQTGELSQGDAIHGQGADREISVINGTLEFRVKDEIYLGNPNANNVVVMLFDYACPHCRKVHLMLDELMEQKPFSTSLLVLQIPVPLNKACNPYLPPEMHSRFDESCELARLGLAFGRTAPEHYPAFSKWMFANPDPRSYADARAYVLKHVSEETLDKAMDDAMIKKSLDRNVAAFGAVGEDRMLPVLARPGNPMIIGRIEDESVLKDFLNGVVIKKKPKEEADVWATDADETLD